MLFCRMVDLSILRVFPGSMVPSSLMSTLNWSRLFFSDLFLETLYKVGAWHAGWWNGTPSHARIQWFITELAQKTSSEFSLFTELNPNRGCVLTFKRVYIVTSHAAKIIKLANLTASLILIKSTWWRSLLSSAFLRFSLTVLLCLSHLPPSDHQRYCCHLWKQTNKQTNITNMTSGW